jgi:hypothetical protein
MELDQTVMYEAWKLYMSEGRKGILSFDAKVTEDGFEIIKE